MQMLSSRAFVLNDLTREGQALSAADFAAEALVGAFGMRRAGTYSVANFIFSQGIANADDHRLLLMRISYHK